jgi:hypothetical protein
MSLRRFTGQGLTKTYLRSYHQTRLRTSTSPKLAALCSTQPPAILLFPRLAISWDVVNLERIQHSSIGMPSPKQESLAGCTGSMGRLSKDPKHNENLVIMVNSHPQRGSSQGLRATLTKHSSASTRWSKVQGRLITLITGESKHMPGNGMQQHSVTPEAISGHAEPGPSFDLLSRCHTRCPFLPTLALGFSDCTSIHKPGL